MLVTLKTYRDSIDAELDKGYLEAQGIECFLMNEGTVNANWLYSQAIGGIELQVPQEKVDEALAYLNDRN